MPPGSQPGHGVVLQRHTNQEVVLERSTAASTSQEAAHATQQEPEAQLGGSGEEAAEIAAATFDPAVHQRYLDLPPWPPTTHAELTVGWRGRLAAQLCAAACRRRRGCRRGWASPAEASCDLRSLACTRAGLLEPD